MLHDFDHFTAYEMARFDDYPNRDKEEDALFDILGPDNCIRIPKYMASSAEILPPYNKIKDIDLFESIGEGSVGQKRDLISEAKNASKRRKTMSRQNSTRLQFPSLFPTEPSQMTTTDSKINPSQVTDESHRSIKSLPSKQRSSSKVHPSSSQDSCPTSLLSSKYIPPHEAKHPSPSSATVAEVSSIEPLLSSVNEPEEKNNCLPITREIYNERKNLIIKMIKEEMIKQGKVIIKENEPFFQQVYVSMRYNYMKVMNADKDMDLKWLQIVIKMHIDFFLQMEKIVDALL
ncbi:uncharacterized protein BX663DRAFT_514301 [Cokeromyces recurvatus]|uniref:uncharacterized protein n=1 Tax=Cokeromyces recurvatus TaxID=90255 RepID=UPI00221E6091|nr:uncharacterized protein BX663DRAFT_514301 [Cokeromyces recurvatus]KAI7901389.1 hypothetical protein BX663DRAFT_514301 [Cokeromyces recurvatus]